MRDAIISDPTHTPGGEMELKRSKNFACGAVGAETSHAVTSSFPTPGVGNEDATRPLHTPRPHSAAPSAAPPHTLIRISRSCQVLPDGSLRSSHASAARQAWHARVVRVRHRVVDEFPRSQPAATHTHEHSNLPANRCTRRFANRRAIDLPDARDCGG